MNMKAVVQSAKGNHTSADLKVSPRTPQTQSRIPLPVALASLSEAPAHVTSIPVPENAHLRGLDSHELMFSQADCQSTTHNGDNKDGANTVYSGKQNFKGAIVSFGK